MCVPASPFLLVPHVIYIEILFVPIQTSHFLGHFHNIRKHGCFSATMYCYVSLIAYSSPVHVMFTCVSMCTSPVFHPPPPGIKSAVCISVCVCARGCVYLPVRVFPSASRGPAPPRPSSRHAWVKLLYRCRLQPPPLRACRVEAGQKLSADGAGMMQYPTTC